MLLHARALVRRVALASWTSNWSSCFLYIPWIIPKLLYGVYADSAFTLWEKLSVLLTISMYHDLSCAAMTGAPFRVKDVVITWKKHLSKFSVPPIAFKISFQSCASRCVCFITSAIDSCFSPVFDILLLSTNPNIPMIVLNVPCGSLYCDPYLCLSCMSSAIDTSLHHPVVDIVIPWPDSNTSESDEWLYVSLDTPFAVLIAYLAYHNRSSKSQVNSGGIWYDRKYKHSMCGIILSKHTVVSLLNRTNIRQVMIIISICVTLTMTGSIDFWPEWRCQQRGSSITTNSTLLLLLLLSYKERYLTRNKREQDEF